MNLTDSLENQFGGSWVGIAFHDAQPAPNSLTETPMRLCEAITLSRTAPVTLSRSSLCCAGGRRALGWGKGNDNPLADNLAAKAEVCPSVARKVIAASPHLERKIAAVTVGRCQAPDVVVSYIQPEAVMNLVRAWEAARGGRISIQLTSFMTVCANAVVEASQTCNLCASFGCPDARIHSDIGRDRLAVAMSALTAKALLRGQLDTIPSVGEQP